MSACISSGRVLGKRFTVAMSQPDRMKGFKFQLTKDLV